MLARAVLGMRGIYSKTSPKSREKQNVPFCFECPFLLDEYASYVGGVYRLLAEKPTEAQLIAHLRQIETVAMGGALRDTQSLLLVVRKLMAINVSLEAQ